MEQLIQFLDSVHPVSENLKDHLRIILKEKRLSKKDYLLKAGHICRTICFIQNGLLRCFYNKGDTEICSWFMKEGDVIVSIESFFHQKESYESIQALEDCTLHYIEYGELQHIYRQFPEFNFTGRLLTEKYYGLWAQQLYGLRMQTAQERYSWLFDNFSDLLLRVPSKYLASYLGITEVTLSKIKSKK